MNLLARYRAWRDRRDGKEAVVHEAYGRLMRDGSDTGIAMSDAAASLMSGYASVPHSPPGTNPPPWDPRGADFAWPIDDIGPYGGMAVVLSQALATRPSCTRHGWWQPCAWIIGRWVCPVDGCGYVLVPCPMCGSEETFENVDFDEELGYAIHRCGNCSADFDVNGGDEVSYFAKDGKVYVRDANGVREVTTAVTASGRDLERFEAVRQTAAAQRKRGAS